MAGNKKGKDEKKRTGIIISRDLHAWAKSQSVKDTLAAGYYIGFNDLINEGLERVRKARREGKGHEDL